MIEPTSLKFHFSIFKCHNSLLKPTSRHFFKVNEFDGPGFAHGPHGVDDVVLQRVDPVLLVQTDRAHGLLAHGTLVSVSGTLKLFKLNVLIEVLKSHICYK